MVPVGAIVVLLVAELLVTGCTSSALEPAGTSTSGCIRRAKLALHDADFYRIRSIAGSGGTVTAEHDGYRAELRCAGGSIDVTVTGPDSFQVDWYRDTIVRKF